MTRKREAVYAALCACASHPTADELYFFVRERAPGISLGTVYNTLELLVSLGLARRIHGGTAARYEIECAPHGHVRCARCGDVRDYRAEEVAGWISPSSLPEGFTLQEISVDITGVCARCRAAAD